MVRGLSDHLDMQNHDETSPTAISSSRKTRRSTTPPPPPPPQGAPPPPPPPPPGPPPSQLPQRLNETDPVPRRQRDPPAISIVESGPATLSPAYRKKAVPRVNTTDLGATREGPVSLTLPSKASKRSKGTPKSCQAAVPVTYTSLKDEPLVVDTRIGPNGSSHPRLEESQQHPQQLASPNMLMDTVRDLSTAASGTFEKFREWGNNGFISPRNGDGAEQNSSAKFMKGTSEHVLDKFSTETAVYDDTQYSHMSPHGLPVAPGPQKPKPTILQDLAWPFMACGVDVGDNLNLPSRQQFEPQLRRVKDAVTQAVNGDIQRANDIWRLAGQHMPNGQGGDDEIHSVVTYDTVQEDENNQIRRLASWGTINTMATTETDASSLASKSMDMKPGVGMEDDDGNVIDPLLLEKAQQAREKRQPRRTKLVKFDYPPIRSLRQCPRPNPADLPDLFFTENELDQIEDDRYSTMSTDDVEIVAVSSKNSDGGEPPMTTRFHKSSSIPTKEGSKGKVSIGEDPPNSRDPPERTLKPSKGRPSTPFRSSNRENWGDDDTPAPLARSSSGNDKRLVKGVQIYLRERSTGNI